MKHLFTAFAAATVALSATAYDLSYTVDPAEGEVEMLQTVTLTFPNVDEVEINSKDDLTITRDGQVVRGVEVSWKYPNKIQFVLGAEQTEPAIYNVNLPAYSISGYADLTDDGYQWFGINEEDIVLTYEIKGGAQAGVFDWSYMVMPDEGVVDEIREIQVFFPSIEDMDINSKSDIVLSHNGTPVEGVAVSLATNLISIEPADVLKEAGEYTLTFPAGVFAGYGNDNGDGYEDFELNPETIVLTWTIEGEAPEVESDLTLAINTPKPNADGQISAEKSLESIFFYCEMPGLGVAADAQPVTIEGAGNYKASGKLRKAFGVNSNYTYFSVAFGNEPTYNGEYVVTVPAGAFGDEAWLANPATGHTNAELKIAFTLVDGAELDIYTIKPVAVSPEAGTYTNGSDVAVFTVKFEAGVTPVKDAAATLAALEGSYVESAVFVADGEGYTAKFDTVPAEDGAYQLSVPAGAFTDGSLFNAPIEVVYTISVSNGVAMVIGEGEVTVYDLNGRKINSPVKELPAGVYVINGHKVVVR